MTVKLYLGDCLEIMPTLAEVDAIITDIPYGTTACSWDEVIPFDEMWEQVERVTGVFVTTASQPFTSKLVMSNLDWFKYEWIWNKVRGVGHFNAKIRPMISTESICVFGKNGHTYNPQMRERDKPRKSKNNATQKVYGKSDKYSGDILNKRYPVNLITFSKSSQADMVSHPTQKPIALYEYLVKTYTNEGDTVCDITMGSGTTGVACVQTGRNFIGIEIEPKYYEIAEARIAEAQLQIRMEI